MRTTLIVNLILVGLICFGLGMVGFATVISLNQLFSLKIPLDGYSIASAAFLWIMLHAASTMGLHPTKGDSSDEG